MDRDFNEKELFTEDEYLMLQQQIQSQQQPAPPRRKRSGFGARLYAFLCGFVPKWGDKPMEWVRKSVAIFAVSVMIMAGSYLLNELVILPTQYEQQIEFLGSLYQPGVSQPLTPEEQEYKYPAGISDDFKKLYYMNDDVRGWLTFQSTEPTDGGTPFIDISYPVLYSGDNEFYLDHDFYKVQNRNGSLFLDYRNYITNTIKQKSTIIYGHNLSNEQMLTRLNYLVRYGIYYARHATRFTFDTLYEKNEYLVFAVMVCNVEEREGPVFHYLRTGFADDADFTNFIAEIRARSLYDYTGVSVQAGDEIVILSTCNSQKYAGIEEGRTVVVARKVREGENTNINKYSIVENTDVIMPYAWYMYKGLEPHEYYTNGDFVLPDITTTSTTTTTTETQEGETTTTETQEGETTTTERVDDETTTGQQGQTTTTATDDTGEGETTTTTGSSEGETTTSGSAEGETTTTTGETTTTAQQGETTTTTTAETTASENITTTTTTEQTTTTTTTTEQEEAS